MARWTASAKWAAGAALDGQRDMPLELRLSEGLGPTCHAARNEHIPYSLNALGEFRFRISRTPASEHHSKVLR
jgi:hypothetical protein